MFGVRLSSVAALRRMECWMFDVFPHPRSASYAACRVAQLYAAFAEGEMR